MRKNKILLYEAIFLGLIFVTISLIFKSLLSLIYAIFSQIFCLMLYILGEILNE